MEWNRWPVSCLNQPYESDSHLTQEMEQLDMALALQDQMTLLESLQVVALKTETAVSVVEENIATSAESEQSAHSFSEKIARGINGMNEEHYSKLYQATVEMARSLAAALEFVSNASSTESVNNGAVEQEITTNRKGIENIIPVVSDVLCSGSAEPSICSNLPVENERQNKTDLILNRAEGQTSGSLEKHMDTTCASELQNYLHVLQDSLPLNRNPDKTSSTNDIGVSFPCACHGLHFDMDLLGVDIAAYNRCLPSNPWHQKTFPFVCGQSFRRDQFSSHVSNVHGDIHAGLSGWMEHRCPLAHYGCSFSQRRFYPCHVQAKVVHDKHLKSFGIQPCPQVKPPSASQPLQFSELPTEVLWHIARFLDSFSLCQLSLVSRSMRDVCASLLQSRGIVELRWERRPCPGSEAVSWQVKNKIWRFSTAFSPVSSWGFADVPSMSDHLKNCTFNTVEHKTEPIPLTAMCTEQDGQSLRRTLRHISF